VWLNKVLNPKRNNKMKLIKKATITLIIVFVLFWLFCLMTGYVIVIPVTKYIEKHIELKQGDTINPLAKLDFSRGEWKAYFVVSKSDYKNLTNSITKAGVLKTINIVDLKTMQKEWLFRYTGGDMTTAESSFYVFNDGKLVYRSGIIFDEQKVGLQSREYGWLEPIHKEMITSGLKNFKRVYWPVVFL